MAGFFSMNSLSILLFQQWNHLFQHSLVHKVTKVIAMMQTHSSSLSSSANFIETSSLSLQPQYSNVPPRSVHIIALPASVPRGGYRHALIEQSRIGKIHSHSVIKSDLQSYPRKKQSATISPLTLASSSPAKDSCLKKIM